MTDRAAQLLQSRAAGDHCPEWLVGSLDLPQALQMQLAVLADKIDQGATKGGWKVGLTSETSRAKLGSNERPFGYVLGERVFESETTIDSATVRKLSIETEMCFTVGTTIDAATIEPGDVLDYMSHVSAGFELNEVRAGSARPDFFAMVTDCLTNWGIVCGPGVVPASPAALSSTSITMSRNGEEVFNGISRDYVDDHTISLSRLVEQLGRHDERLVAGQKVITGAFARFPTEPGDRWQATYENIGSVEINIV